MTKALVLSCRNLFGSFGALIAVSAIPSAIQYLPPIDPIDEAMLKYKTLIDWWNNADKTNIKFYAGHDTTIDAVQLELCNRANEFVKYLMGKFPKNPEQDKTSWFQLKGFFEGKIQFNTKQDFQSINKEIVPLVFIRNMIKIQKLPLVIDKYKLPQFKIFAHDYKDLILSV